MIFTPDTIVVCNGIIGRFEIIFALAKNGDIIRITYQDEAELWLRINVY